MQLKLFASYIIACFVFINGKAIGETPCPNNYYKLNTVNAATFAAAPDGICQFGNYSLMTIPDDFVPIYTGFVSGTAITLCNNGYMSNGECVSYQQSLCESGNYNLALDSGVFAAATDAGCQFGNYSVNTIPDDFTPIYTGFVAGTAITLCDNGYMSNGECVQYTTGTCNAGYYDLSINENSFAELTNGTCSNPYVTTTQTTRCDRNAGDTCLMLNTPEINLDWYSGDTILSQTSCFYEESIDLPQPPNRPGYTFVGWQLRTE